jgi:transposase-like protein
MAGRQALVRNGDLPEREVQPGLGAVRVQVPRVRARSGAGIRVHAALLPPELRRSTSLEALWPWLDLKGISPGDCSEAFQALLGPEAPGVSPATLRRLKPGWQAAWTPWQRRDLTGKRDVSCWGDGVDFEPRLDDARPGMLVIIGAATTGQQDLLGRWDGDRDSEQSWQEVLLDLKRRGLGQAPAVALGDGAVGCWKALRQGYGQTRGPRGWVPKTVHGLDQLSQDLQPQAKHRWQAIWLAPDRQRAVMAFDLCIASSEAKYPKAAECLAQDREGL